MKIGFKGSTIFIHINLSNAVLGGYKMSVKMSCKYNGKVLHKTKNIKL